MTPEENVAGGVVCRHVLLAEATDLFHMPVPMHCNYVEKVSLCAVAAR
jgi:hypothetical protein